VSKLSQQNNRGSEDLDKEFEVSFNKMSELRKTIAPDIMLKLYAYYKQASFGNKFSFNRGIDVRNAFKFNAWIQLNGMSTNQAKKEYIKLANTILNNKKQNS
jgi:diazepam-binding inhibitor (GABA receptor modulating acyl-CoA-binding protein)